MIEITGSGVIDVGRWAYLRAMNKHWPEPLQDLIQNIYPNYVPPFATDPDSVNRSSIEDDWSRIEGDPHLRALADSFAAWSTKFKVRDKWILDAAMHTLNQRYKVELYPRLAYVAGLGKTWMYVDPTQIRLVPQMPPQSWLPRKYGNEETWKEFSSRISSEIRSQLFEYRRAIDRRYGEGPAGMDRDARWTVLFQKGESFSSIASELPRHKDPTETVTKAIKRFSSRIGLTLRTKR